MIKRIIFVLLGILLSAAAVVMLHRYLTAERQRIQAQAQEAFKQQTGSLVSVIVAKTDIPAGMELRPEMLGIGIAPQQYIQPNAVMSLEGLAGMVASSPIAANEQIVMTKLIPYQMTQETKEKTLASVTPQGKRAITVDVDNIAGLVGMVKPGDQVDVIAKVAMPEKPSDQNNKAGKIPVTVPLFQNVLILAIGNDIYKGVNPKDPKSWEQWGKTEEKKDPALAPLLTLALTAEEANVISFVRENGKIQLAMRSPKDNAQVAEKIPPTTWDTLFAYLEKQSPGTIKKDDGSSIISNMTSVRTEEPKRIEIYRGLNRETIAVGKK